MLNTNENFWPDISDWKIDEKPEMHPFLRPENIRIFKNFSEEVVSFSEDYCQKYPDKATIAFAVNLAGNMHQWFRLARQSEVDCALFLHPHDHSLMSQPEWDEYDGVADENTKLSDLGDLYKDVYRIPLEDHISHCFDTLNKANSLQEVSKVIQSLRSIRLEHWKYWKEFSSYYPLIKKMAEYDVSFVANTPYLGYLTGKPYAALPTGGDLRIGCAGRNSVEKLNFISFHYARYIICSSMLPLNYMRRLGLVNGLYLPYPVNLDFYSPGVGVARQKWQERWGEGTYILNIARINYSLKGQEKILFTVQNLIQKFPKIHFIFLCWGSDLTSFKDAVTQRDLNNYVHFLPIVGKQKLVDYIRSCDFVIDNLSWGYMGNSAREALAVGKPVIMNLNIAHYREIYEELPPVCLAVNYVQLAEKISFMMENPEKRNEIACKSRQWMSTYHNGEKLIKKLVSVLTIVARQVKIKIEPFNILKQPISQEEVEYYKTL